LEVIARLSHTIILFNIPVVSLSHSNLFCLQRYSLEFSFYHVINTGAGISNSYAHLRTSPGHYRAAIAFQFGIQLLLRDAEHAISTSIHNEVRLAVNEFGPTLQTNERISNLNAWLEVDDLQKKFSHYSPHYRQLVHAITNTVAATTQAPTLPRIRRPPVAPHVIGQSLFAKANKGPTRSGRARTMTGAPLFQGGSFNRILPALIQMVCNQMSLANPSELEKKAFVGDTAINVFNHLRITILPWSDAQSGSDSSWSVFNSWITIATSSQSSTTRPHSHQVTIISDDEMDIDLAAGPSLQHTTSHQPPPFVDSWIPSSLSLLELPAHLHVMLRPDELEHISSHVLAMKDVIQENYQWAYSTYSAQNPIHRLAFIISSVMSGMAPSYMVVTRSAPRNNPPPWTDTHSATRHPLQSGPICFGWWLMYLLTMLDSQSPLRRSIQPPIGGRRVILGSDWVDTMSEQSIFTCMA
jgi:hypothetical protein